MNFTRISSYFFTRMYPYVSRMLVICYSYVSVCSVCYSYVTRMLLVCYPYVLVWCFSHDRQVGSSTALEVDRRREIVKM